VYVYVLRIIIHVIQWLERQEIGLNFVGEMRGPRAVFFDFHHHFCERAMVFSE